MAILHKDINQRSKAVEHNLDIGKLGDKTHSHDHTLDLMTENFDNKQRGWTIYPFYPLSFDNFRAKVYVGNCGYEEIYLENVCV